MEKLIILLRGTARMSPTLEAHLRSILTPKKYKEGEILLREGEVSKRIFYIEKGLVRSYYEVGEKDVSNWFMKEGDICISVISFFGQLPSTDTIIALEDCELWGISHAQLEESYTLFPEFERHGRLISNRYYVMSEQRHQLIKRQTPIDKYTKLMDTNPDLISRITSLHLASFLNISDRTLRRIRNEYSALKKKSK
ncbi:MAG TPA: cyclic nucleotide-binding domain-containing protein [Puia sp.]|nr:cyclic nucleotide-binding domain-containing protein [Puia sp.]